MLQRAVHEALLADAAADSVWAMTDRDLLNWLERSPSDLARSLTRRLMGRELHRSCVVLKPTGYGYVERCSDKPVGVVEWSRTQLRRFASIVESNERLREMEDELAGRLGLAPGDVLFAAMPYFRKLLPQDVCIHSSHSDGSFGLFDKDLDHRRSLEGDYLRTFSVRLVVPDGQRERVTARSQWVSELLESWL
jgi:hypothetical protein